MFAAWLRQENKQKHRKSHQRHVRLSPAGTVTKPHDIFFCGNSAAPLPRCYRATKTRRAVTGGCELLACLHSLSLACRSNNRCFTCSFPSLSTTHPLNAIPNSHLHPHFQFYGASTSQHDTKWGTPPSSQNGSCKQRSRAARLRRGFQSRWKGWKAHLLSRLR
jgi:hypothetical protein